jgi:hypothetical protein
MSPSASIASRAVSRIAPPDDWQPLRTREDWKVRRGGLLVVHQRTPIGGEAPTKYHGRDCRHVQHRDFLDGPARGTDNSEWFRVPDAASARRGGAVACQQCGGA